MRTTLVSFVILAIAAVASALAGPLPTTLDDFILPGTQPETLPTEIRLSSECSLCHTPSNAISRWQGSLMAHAARDPLFYACLTIAEQDAPGSGEICIRCHVPRAWLAGRSTPTDGAAITMEDRDGINCQFCHQMVDPIDPFDDAPAIDEAILTALGLNVPTSVHTGTYVMDPDDRNRRGPFADANSPHPHPTSPFHQRSDLCATCHDVSNPAHSRQPDGSYLPNTFGEKHPTADKRDMFPIERTYSEWTMSAFAQGPIEMGGRFGGNKTAVSTCQDCHLPDTDGVGALNGVFRTDLPNHDFNGAGNWVLDAIKNLYPNEVNAPAIDAAKLRNKSMLERAATMELQQISRMLKVRIINETGHKLPSGYPEGRRVWLNVVFRDNGDNIIHEHGHYDPITADLDTASTKVYETVLGMDPTVAAASGLSPGKSFHFVLNNVILKDNRIPPRGFTNANFATIQASPVDYTYADGDYWDDTFFTVPPNAAKAEATLYYQTSSKEYIEFLRDANVTDNRGDVLYQQWELTGKSAPVEMVDGLLDVLPLQYGDFDADGDVDMDDFDAFQACISGAELEATRECTPMDADGDTDIDQSDFGQFQLNITGPM